MEKYKRLGKNTLLVFVGNIGSKSISFLMLPFYTKWLSVEEYGVTDVITIYATFLLGIVTGSIVESIFIFPKDKNNQTQREYFSTGLYIVAISFIISAILFFLTTEGFNFFQIENSFSNYSWWIFWIIIATFLQNYMQQFSRSIDKISVYAISGIVLTASTAILAFVLIPKYGIKGFLLAQIISLLIGAFYTLIHSKAYGFFQISRINKERGLEMLRYSIPLIPNGIMWLLVSALNRPVLEHYFGMNEVGLFAVANKFPSILIVVFSIFIFSWQISVLEEFKKPDYKVFYNKMLRSIFLVLTFLSCVVTIFSKTIISVMTDEKFFESWKILPLLVFAVLFSSLSGFVGTNFSATKQSKYYFYSSLWGALGSIVLNLVLIPFYGLNGAAIAVVLSYGIMAVSRIKYSWNLVKISSLYVYVMMLLINILVIVITLYTQNIILKGLLYLILFTGLLLLNKNVLFNAKDFYLRYRNNL